MHTDLPYIDTEYQTLR